MHFSIFCVNGHDSIPKSITERMYATKMVTLLPVAQQPTYLPSLCLGHSNSCTEFSFHTSITVNNYVQAAEILNLLDLIAILQTQHFAAIQQHLTSFLQYACRIHKFSTTGYNLQPATSVLDPSAIFQAHLENTKILFLVRSPRAPNGYFPVITGRLRSFPAISGRS